MQVYLVGGAVRDQLLNREVKERDWVVVGGTREQMLTDGFREVGKDFPVFIHPQTGEEYALARTERKTSHGYAGFECYAAPDVTLEDDLRRRDLTINAMAQDEHGLIIDPFNGKSDLKNRVLRHISPAFAEDPLRVLRVARFAARYAYLGFTVANETLALMSSMVSTGEIEYLVPERVCKELLTALAEETPSQFFSVLRQCGANKVLFPEIEQLFGVPAEKKWHPEIDTGIHVMMVIDQAAQLNSTIESRFAALLHDLGKGVTDQKDWPKHPDHEKTGLPLVKHFCQRLKTPKSYRELALLVTQWHGKVHSVLSLDAEEIVLLLEKCDAFRRPQRFEHLLMACQADAQGRAGYEQSEYPQADFCRLALQAAKSVSIHSLKTKELSGEEIAKELHRLRTEAIRILHKS